MDLQCFKIRLQPHVFIEAIIVSVVKLIFSVFVFTSENAYSSEGDEWIVFLELTSKFQVSEVNSVLNDYFEYLVGNSRTIYNSQVSDSLDEVKRDALDWVELILCNPGFNYFLIVVLLINFLRLTKLISSNMCISSSLQLTSTMSIALIIHIMGLAISSRVILSLFRYSYSTIVGIGFFTSSNFYRLARNIYQCIPSC